jgi:hypothetical protein
MTTDDLADLAEIAKAHGQVGRFNAGYWRKLVAKHGEAAVLAACDEYWQDNRQAPTANQADEILGGGTGCRPSRPADDDADDLATAWSPHGAAALTPAAATTTTPLPAPSTPAPAAPAADDDRSPTSAAAGEATAREAAAAKPWGLTPPTTPPLEKPMPKIDPLLTKVAARISERGIKQGDAAGEIGCSGGSLSALLTGRAELGDRLRPKIEAWLNGKAVTPTEQPAAPKVAKATTATGGGTAVRPDSPSDSPDLLERGATLARNLAGVGAADGAEIVTQLVDRLRQVRMAVAG